VIDPVLVLLIAVPYALLFADAATQKLRALHLFRAVLSAYAVLPRVLVRPASSLLPLAEAVTAAGLLFGATRRVAALIAAGLLVLYAAGLAVNLRRGRRDLDCGCTGPAERRPIRPYMVTRNLMLAALLGLATLPEQPRRLEPADALTLLAGILCIVVLYRAVDAALARPLEGRP
jgi:hypothetical protein